MSLKSAIVSLFMGGRRKREAQLKHDSERIDEAQKQCATVTLKSRKAAQELKESVARSATLHDDVRSRMPTRKIVKCDLDDEYTDTASMPC